MLTSKEQIAAYEEITAPNVKMPPPPQMTEEEFVEWCDEDIRAEWVDGEVVVASPPSSRHADLVGFLLVIMRLIVARRNLGSVYGEVQVRLATIRCRRVPDILFVAQDRLSIVHPNHIEGAPDLVVEIVSPDSVARDWEDKLLEYETGGVREYWVIDPMAQRIEAYVLGGDRRYASIQAQDATLHSNVLAGFWLRPSWLWQDPLPDPFEVLKELGVL